MFFFLSKFLSFLLSPGIWIVILLVFAAIKRSKPYAKKFVIAAVVLFIFFSNQFIYKKIQQAWLISKTNMKPDQVYTGILLGGLVQFDKNDKPTFNPSGDRFIQTLKLYNQHKLKKIILSAGSGSVLRPHLNEALMLKEELMQNGVPDSVIIMDSQSRNTSENGKIAKHIIDSLHLQTPYLLITSAIHMRRSIAVFEKEGIHADVYPCAFMVVDGPVSGNDFIPQFYILASWEQLIKEMVGLAVYKLTGKA